MAFQYKWTKGYFADPNDRCKWVGGAIVRFEESLNRATPEALQAFIAALSGPDPSLMEARAQLEGLSEMDKRFKTIDAAWYGRGGPPMWIVSSKLTPEQIHDVMVTTAIHVAELRLGDESLQVEMFCHCGFDWFHTEVSLQQEPKLIRVWILGPNNMASAFDSMSTGPLRSDAESQALLEQLAEAVGSGKATVDQIKEAKDIAYRWDCFAHRVFEGTVLSRGDVKEIDGIAAVEPRGESRELSELSESQQPVQGPDRTGVEADDIVLVTVDPAGLRKWLAGYHTEVTGGGEAMLS